MFRATVISFVESGVRPERSHSTAAPRIFVLAYHVDSGGAGECAIRPLYPLGWMPPGAPD